MTTDRRSKDSFDSGTQHNDTWIDERQNILLLTAPNERRLPGRATQGDGPGDRVRAASAWQAGWNYLRF